METVQTKYTTLVKAWEKGDTKSADSLIQTMEDDIVAAAMQISSTTATCSSEGLKAVMSCLEIAVLHHVSSKTSLSDGDQFALYMSLLRHVYTTAEASSGDATIACDWSDRRAEIHALHLLHLLTNNQVSDFHAFLEQLSDNGSKRVNSGSKIGHPHIQFVHKLEQLLTEGRYNCIFNMINKPKDGQIPPKSFTAFLDKLTDTIRDEIASSMVTAYDKIAVDEAQTLLQLKSVDNLRALATSRGWSVAGGFVTFNAFEGGTSTIGGSKSSENLELATEELAMMSIAYARELEQIV